MDSPTMKETAGWLRESAVICKDLANYWGADGEKEGRVWLDRAAQVEAMGERRCLNCKEWLGGIHPVFGCPYEALIHCKKLNIPGQGPNFCCIHWKRKEGGDD